MNYANLQVILTNLTNTSLFCYNLERMLMILGLKEEKKVEQFCLRDEDQCSLNFFLKTNSFIKGKSSLNSLLPFQESWITVPILFIVFRYCISLRACTMERISHPLCTLSLQRGSPLCCRTNFEDPLSKRIAPNPPSIEDWEHWLLCQRGSSTHLYIDKCPTTSIYFSSICN